MFSVERKHHCLPVDLQQFAVRHCRCRPHAESLARKRTFSEKISLAQYAQGCFLANLGYDSESNLAFLDVEDCVSGVALREDCCFLGKATTFRPSPIVARNFFGSKSRFFLAGTLGAIWLS